MSNATQRLRLVLPSANTLRETLDYNYETGRLIWRPKSGSTPATRMWNTRYAGTQAGTSVSPHGYIALRIEGQRFWAHRVIWKMVYGEEPPVEIDHVDGNPSNNRLDNLRTATIGQNRANARRQSASVSGAKGVRRNGDRWMAMVTWDGRTHYLGTFDTVAEAKAARDAKARELHGEFFNPG